MLCGSCLNDNALATALIRQGHEVALTPIYTPMRTESASAAVDKVFYGAINVYLKSRSGWYRRLPRFLRKTLDSRAALRWAAKQDRAVDARELGELTLSTLLGEDGAQAEELDSLVGWLRDSYKPQLVHLSNSMLVGMAPVLKRELGVPVLCSLQGEDIFLDDLPEPFRTNVFETFARKAEDVDAFVATGRYYVDHMRDYLSLKEHPIHGVPLGIELEGLADRPERAADASAPFTVGYLARICPEKGLHVLIDGFRQLAERVGQEQVRLRIAGYLGARDKDYHDDCVRAVERAGLSSVVEFCGEVDREGKIAFLHSIDVMSVPTVYREPKGRSILEALACGVPVVQPAHGTFPELVEATGGGLLVEPGDSSALAEALGRLLADRDRARELGRSGRAAVQQEFTDDAMAARMIDVYREYAS